MTIERSLCKYMNLPNNFIELSLDCCRKTDFNKEAELLRVELDKVSKENDIQSYIKNNKKWFIPLSILKNYDFGHHFACVVPEYSLGNEYRVDYLLIGKNSLGYQFVFVEFEDVNVDFRNKTSNSATEKVRKGITQLKDWRRWIDRNKNYFEGKEGIKEFCRNIPSWGFHYCLVVGRRERMDNISNMIRGEMQDDFRGLKIISYDRLIENVSLMHNGI